MYALEIKNEVIGTCVITDEGNSFVEIKTLQQNLNAKQGYGKQLIDFLVKKIFTYSQVHHC